jgi:O-antigen ligase
MKADWVLFLENPILGVGPGQSFGAHVIAFRAAAAHTEYTRLIAEHGSFGVIAMLMLLWMAWRRFRRTETTTEKGIGLACMAWAVLYMGHSAMRLSAPALMFGLGSAMLVIGKVELPRRWREASGTAPPLRRVG